MCIKNKAGNTVCNNNNIINHNATLLIIFRVIKRYFIIIKRCFSCITHAFIIVKKKLRKKHRYQKFIYCISYTTAEN